MLSQVQKIAKYPQNISHRWSKAMNSGGYTFYQAFRKNWTNYQPFPKSVHACTLYTVTISHFQVPTFVSKPHLHPPVSKDGFLENTPFNSVWWFSQLKKHVGGGSILVRLTRWISQLNPIKLMVERLLFLLFLLIPMQFLNSYILVDLQLPEFPDEFRIQSRLVDG